MNGYGYDSEGEEAASVALEQEIARWEEAGRVMKKRQKQQEVERDATACRLVQLTVEREAAERRRGSRKNGTPLIAPKQEHKWNRELSDVQLSA